MVCFPNTNPPSCSSHMYIGTMPRLKRRGVSKEQDSRLVDGHVVDTADYGTPRHATHARAQALDGQSLWLCGLFNRTWGPQNRVQRTLQGRARERVACTKPLHLVERSAQCGTLKGSREQKTPPCPGLRADSQTVLEAVVASWLGQADAIALPAARTLQTHSLLAPNAKPPNPKPSAPQNPKP